MWYTASLAHQFEHAADYGFNVSVEGHDWSVVKSHRDAYVNRLNGIYEDLLDGSGVEYLAGAARFVDAHTVAVGDQDYSAERIVIATGGRPIVPDVPGAALGITSDDFCSLLAVVTLPWSLPVYFQGLALILGCWFANRASFAISTPCSAVS
jgi:glutathione reductase (NADPH)